MMFSFAEFRKHTYSQDKVKIQLLKHIMFSHQKNSRGLWLTVCQIRRIIRSAEVHLDVVQVFALAQIVVIGSGEEAGLVTPYYGLQITAIHIEIQRLESIHRHLACCCLRVQTLRVTAPSPPPPPPPYYSFSIREIPKKTENDFEELNEILLP